MIYSRGKKLWTEKLSIQQLVEQWGSPLYIYSQSAIEKNWREFSKGCGDKPHLICYAVKANSNLSILKLFSTLGAGFDIVSQGELERVLLAGGHPKKIIFSGVGKTESEIERALHVGIYCFNVESIPELDRINDVAKKLKCVAPISLRVNPNISIKAHPYITTGLNHNKFGIAMDQALDAYMHANKLRHLQIQGVSCHLGSQITELEPFVLALEKLLSLAEKLAKQSIRLNFIDIGGGLGIHYQNEKPIAVSKYLSALWKKMRGYPYSLVFEPGRALIGNAGVLATKIEYIKKTKHKNFAIVNAAMNDLIRPALYDAWHNIVPVTQRSIRKETYDVVGPVCETGDFLGLDRKLAILPKDILVVTDTGAYGSSLSSNYNTRPRPAEILVSGKKVKLIRERETYDDLLRKESLV